MYSQCPDCLTRFRVTADALRAARGTVRCGQCGAAFDALARLSDSLPDREPAQPGAVGAERSETDQRAEELTEYHFSLDDIEKVFVDARAWEDKFAGNFSPQAIGIAGEGAEPPLIIVEDNEAFENITLETSPVEIGLLSTSEKEAVAPFEEAEFDPDATDEVEILEEYPDEVAFENDLGAEPATAEPSHDEAPGGLDAPLRDVPQPERAAGSTPGWHAELDGVQASLEEFDPGQAHADEPMRRKLAWTIGSVALALLLSWQVVHHFRQELLRSPQVGPALRGLYQSAGMTLSPNWDVTAFELRQWGTPGAPDADGRISVRASISNRAAFAQPFPLLRLELEDRFGETVATRDFEPVEYLGSPDRASRLLNAGASAEAELRVVDPGSEAVGYRLEVCLRESASRLRCAAGPG
jgi:predicted Zn finger-like uncharacterized protein